jgi:rod shape-determining protein MreD
VKTAAVVLALGGALLLQTTLSGLFLGAAVTVNLVLVAVVYVALAFGPVTGMVSGMIGGLVQDALAGGIVGLGGLTKTLIGFVVGVLSAQFNLSTTLPRLVMFVVATFVHQVLLAGLYRITGGPHVGLQFSAMLVQALVNGLVGAIAFVLVENGPEALQKRRMRRATTFSKRRY